MAFAGGGGMKIDLDEYEINFLYNIVKSYETKEDIEELFINHLLNKLKRS